MRAAPFRAIATAAAALVVLGLAACSGVSTGATETSGLARAMDSVSGSGPARTWFSYGDLARLRALDAYRTGSGELHVDPRWRQVVGVGADLLANSARLLPDETGIDIYAYDSAVTIGEPPNTAAAFTGAVPAKKITKKLTALGAKPRTFGDAQGLSLNGDNKVDVDSPQTTRLHLVNQLNQVVVTDQRLAAGPNAAALRSVLGGGQSLLDTDGYRDVAACLGDVVAAMIFTPRDTPQARIIAVGVRDAASATDTQHEVVCVLPASGKQQPVRAAMRSALALGATDPIAHRPLSTWFSASTVTIGDQTVRAVLAVRSSASMGWVFGAVQRRVYPAWVGA